MKNILIYSFGSLGDVYPYIAIAKELQRRGHNVVFATSDMYENLVESHGLTYFKIRPDFSHLLNDTEFAKKAMDLKKGGEFIVRELIYKQIDRSYEDLYSVAKKSEVLIAHSLSVVGCIVAQKLKIQWISCALSPNVYLSRTDPSVLPLTPIFQYLPNLGFVINGIFINLVRLGVKSWHDPVYILRKKINLPKGKDPIFDEIHSPNLSLSLFSESFAKRQNDWPSNNIVSGFCFLEEEGNNTKIEKVDKFLADGVPPIIITLGSAAVHMGSKFYLDCVDVLHELNLKCIFLVGNNQINVTKEMLDNFLILDYLPFNTIFDKSRFIVNQGGVGTVAQVLLAGKPMLGIPFSHDQPDNCARMKRLGLGEVLYFVNFTKKRFRKKINHMILNKKNIKKMQCTSKVKFNLKMVLILHVI
jgi:rhamnosyltransferase subunit B